MSKIINNQIIAANIKEIEALKVGLASNNAAYLVEINGSQIQSWEDYISVVQDKFKFPTPCLGSVDRYLDWMRDLGWLEKEEYILIITNYGMFLNNDSKLKSLIIEDFNDVILPFWQDEVKEVVVEGKAKSFMVYLVD
ncbi:MAG: barstar family protein [Clostridiaceae bacterium]|nr:barstar family protein [Clostridiaceae bacterium]